VSGSQFLGYTLHQAHKGTSTALMRDFDTHETVQAAAARFNDLTPEAARRALATMDASVEVECGYARECGWLALAEAPPGKVPTHMAINHFLLDSWVHEYDFMVPRGERPPADRLEAELVVSYLVGLGSLETGSQISLDLRLANPELRVGLVVIEDKRHVTVGSAPHGAAAIEGDVVDLVDRATGRESGPVCGDREAVALLDAFGGLLAR
jgi:hypothetical protein